MAIAILWGSILLLSAGAVSAQSTGSLAERDLLAIYERESAWQKRVEKEGVDGRTETDAQQIDASYRNYLLRHPESIEGLMLYGKFLRKIGDLEQATRVLMEVRRLEPELAVAHQELSNVLAEHGEIYLALTSILQAVALDPENALYHFQLALLLEVSRDDLKLLEEFDEVSLLRQANEAFETAHRLDSRNPDILLTWGEMLELREPPEWAASLPVWERLAGLIENDVQVQVIGLRRARALVELSRYHEARLLLSTITLNALQENRRELETRISASEN